jgi:hypothetical protein
MLPLLLLAPNLRLQLRRILLPLPLHLLPLLRAAGRGRNVFTQACVLLHHRGQFRHWTDTRLPTLVHACVSFSVHRACSASHAGAPSTRSTTAAHTHQHACMQLVSACVQLSIPCLALLKAQTTFRLSLLNSPCSIGTTSTLPRHATWANSIPERCPLPLVCAPRHPAGLFHAVVGRAGGGHARAGVTAGG